MSDRPTPETDENASPHIGFYSCATVTSNFARKLERERDEAREEIKEWETLCLWGGTPEHIHGFIRGQQSRIQHLERERDEAREELHDIRINLGEDADGFTLLHAVCALQNERDDAREYSKATWQSLRYSQDEVLRLTLENRELRNLSNE